MTVNRESSARRVAHQRMTEEPAGAERWADVLGPAIVSRAAGICALAVVALAFIPLNDGFHSSLSAAEVVSWANQHQHDIWKAGLVTGISESLFTLMLVMLAALLANSRLLASLARVGAAAILAIDWTTTGFKFALADLAHRGGADAGILALFSLVKVSDYTDSIAIAFAVGCVSLLLLRSQPRGASRLAGWLGLALAAVVVFAFPLQLMIDGTGSGNGGPRGPIVVVLSLLWLLVTGITLLARPMQRRTAAGSNLPASA